MPHPILRLLCLAAPLALFVALAVAQDAAPATQPAAAAATTQPAATSPSAEQVLNELLQRRAENPLIEPARPAVARPIGASAIGTTPNPESPLHREGQFVVGRRARMTRAQGGAMPWLLTFDADKDGLKDPPMYLLPCQMLEDMEKVYEKYNETAVFIVSGQVFVYHGANYLMPTLMKLAPDRGNLQP